MLKQQNVKTTTKLAQDIQHTTFKGRRLAMGHNFRAIMPLIQAWYNLLQTACHRYENATSLNKLSVPF